MLDTEISFCRPGEVKKYNDLSEVVEMGDLKLPVLPGKQEE